jgi:hypothetical protein
MHNLNNLIMGEYTGKQSLYLCCGYFCSLMGCIGIYFWLVLFFFEATNAPYLVYEMQHIDDMNSDLGKQQIATFKWSFLITAGVNTKSNSVA